MQAVDPQLRQARSHDNTQLIGLARAAPMQGGIRVFADRAPDFFALADLQGDSQVLVVEEQGEIVASLTISKRLETWFGEPRSMLHVGDMRVLPRRRAKGMARLLAMRWFDDLAETGVDGGGFEIMHDNRNALGLLKLFEERPDLRPSELGQAKIYQVLPLWKHRVDKTLDYRKATASDASALADLLQQSYEDYNGHPQFTPDSLNELMQQHPSFTWNDIWLAEKRGKLLACAGFWDQKSVRRTVVETFSSSIHVIAASLRLVRPILGLPEIPRPGQALSYGFVRFPAHLPGERAALGSLCRHLLNEVRKTRKYQFVWFSFHSQDPMQGVLDGLVKLSMPIKLFHCSPVKRKAEWSREPLLERTPYVDFSLV